MTEKKRILVCEFHQETNTFNPIVASFDRFHPEKIFEGEERFQGCISSRGTVSGGVAAIREAGGEAVPTVFMHASSGGRVDDAVLEHLCQRMQFYIENAGEFDAVYAALHGATCTVSENDACGVLLAFLRKLVGDKPIAASFDLHAKITEKVLKNADIICGYQTYPHQDFYGTGYRACKHLMALLAGKKLQLAAVALPVLVPPAGYTTMEEPFKGLMDKALAMIADGRLLDATIFPVQPWLDIPEIESRIVTISEDPEQAKACAQELAQGLFAIKDQMWPNLTSIDGVIDAAEANKTDKPVILADAADSPNGGCVGDSPAVAMRLQERGSTLRTCMFVVDRKSVDQAFQLGVGGKGMFSVGAGFTKGMPGPFKAEGTVRSLHDGYFRGWKHTVSYLGPSAVVSFGNIDILLCDHGAISGSPMIYRSFGMQPEHYDLVVVKANTSFRAPYSTISDLIYFGDTPGAGASNLKAMCWENLPKNLYPFDLPQDYKIESAKLW